MVILHGNTTLKGLATHQSTLGRDLVIFGGLNTDSYQLPFDLRTDGAGGVQPAAAAAEPAAGWKPMFDEWAELDLAGIGV